MENASSRVLIISPNWIGDAIMAQPLLQLLKKKEPDAQIDVLAPAWVAPVWEAMTETAEVFDTPFKHKKLQLSERWKMAKKLKERHYDRAYVLPNTLKYALIPWLAAIPERIGYIGESRYGLINVIHRDDKEHPRPMIPFYAALANPPGEPVLRRQDYPSPKMAVDEKDAENALAAHGIDPARKLVTVAPGAEFGPAKRWPAESFAAAARRILADYPDAQICLMGSPNDRPAGESIAALAPGVANLAGKTTLREAIALLSRTDVLLTNDSGLMHVASAFERPVVAVYGSTDYYHTPPCSKYAEIVSLDLPCAPCQKRECPLGHHRCMKDLPPEKVYQVLEPYLRNPVPFSPSGGRWPD